jgi:transcriptional regulator with XRE-family HTH domain
VNIVSARHDLLENLKESSDYREAYVAESVYALLASQIRVLREQRAWSQKRLGREANMAQERISILEDPNSDTKPTLTTLLRIAAAYDVGLDVRFIPFSRVLDGSFNNNPESLGVPSFASEAMDIDQSDSRLTHEIGLDEMARRARRAIEEALCRRHPLR